MFRHNSISSTEDNQDSNRHLSLENTEHLLRKLKITTSESDHNIRKDSKDIESKVSTLSDIDRVRLETCIQHLKQVVDVRISESELIDIVMLCNFNYNKALKVMFDNYTPETAKQEKDVAVTSNAPTKKAFTIPKLRKKLTELTLTESLSPKTQLMPKEIKSLNAVDKTCDIDLTKALRINKNVPKLRTKHFYAEPITLQFVDCEGDFFNRQASISDCLMDIGDISEERFPLEKEPSSFAKVLCADFPTTRPVLPSDNQDNPFPSDIQHFMFDTPSPDDVIKQNLQSKFGL